MTAVEEDLERAMMSTQDINDLPDDAFGYIEPGGSKDSEGKTVPRSLRHFPLHDKDHVRNALARMSQSPFGDKAAAKIHAAAKRMGIGDYDTDMDTDMHKDRGMDRALHTYGAEIMRYDRTWALEDICITRSKDGRTVEAYAAIWDTPSEVRDQHGHYMERISRTAFDKAIRERGDRIPVFYNHGMTIHATPSDMYSVPIGRSLEVRAESRGLWTLSRYNEGPDADRILEAIRNGAIRAQSFRGRVYKSDPMRIPRPSRNGQLPMVTRTELGLTEYGPTPTPVYADAGILAVRSQAAAAIATLLDRGYDLGRLVELARTSTTPDWEPETSTTSDVEAGTEEPPDGHSARIQQFQAELRKRGVLK